MKEVIFGLEKMEFAGIVKGLCKDCYFKTHKFVDGDGEGWTEAYCLLHDREVKEKDYCSWWEKRE